MLFVGCLVCVAFFCVFMFPSVVCSVFFRIRYLCFVLLVGCGLWVVVRCLLCCVMCVVCWLLFDGVVVCVFDGCCALFVV